MDDNFKNSGEDWDECCSSKVIIEQANSSFNLLSYIESKYLTETVPSSSGWTKKMKCPFHKNGSERTPSLFINYKKNMFYCQACGVSGGIVQFIANTSQKSEELIAECLLKDINGSKNINSRLEQERKIEEKRKAIKVLYDISDLFRDFIQTYLDDDEALSYIDKLMTGFDNVRSINEESVEANIEELYKNFYNYINAYKNKG